MKTKHLLNIWFFLAVLIVVNIYPPIILSQFVDALARIFFMLTVIITGYLLCRVLRVSNVIGFLVLLGLTSFGSLKVIIFGGVDVWSEWKLLLTWVAIINFTLSLVIMVLDDQDRLQYFLKLYKYFSIALVTSALLSLFYILFFKFLDKQVLNGLITSYDYHVSPFGLFLTKRIGDIILYRPSVHFIEPGYFGIFCGLNAVIFSKLRGNLSKWFVRLMLVGGVVSLSLSFVLILVFGWIHRQGENALLENIFLYSSCLIGFVLLISTLPEISSIEIRVFLMMEFFRQFTTFGVFEILFGHGSMKNESDIVHFSSGIITSLYEFGILGTTAITYFIYLLLNRSIHLLFVVMIAFSVVNILKWPLFWLIVVLGGATLREKSSKSFGNRKSLRNASQTT